jgi:hypothetical protein
MVTGFDNLASNEGRVVNPGMHQAPNQMNNVNPSRYGFKGANFSQGVKRGYQIVMNAKTDNMPEDSDTLSTPLNDDSKKIDQAELNKRSFNPTYAYMVLGLVLACRIIVQWGRIGINYAYGYTHLGDAALKTKYEIAASFPELKNWYGLLTGLIYTMPYAFFGMIAGKVSDSVNRKLFLAGVIVAASATMGISAITSSFFMLSLMRVLHGILNSSSNPLSFSLIADYFPPDKRSTANSII